MCNSRARVVARGAATVGTGGRGNRPTSTARAHTVVVGAARARELREVIVDLDNLTDIGGLARLAAR